MEGRDERDPGYDDWFDEPEPPSETQSGVARGVYEDADEVWTLPEDEEPGTTGPREVVIAGRTLTVTQLVIIAACLLAIFFAILAAAGVFNGSTAAPPPATIPTTPVTTTVTAPATTTAANTTPAPQQTLSPGATGSQVKTLQHALTSLGFPVTADGDYGQATQAAVSQFQAAKGLAVDGIVGAQTLTALQQALAKQ